MNPQEVLRIVDAIHRDKNIDKEIVFEGIEAALVSAAKKHYGEEANIAVNIDREDGSIRATYDGRELDSEETVGRIGAQTAKQVMIQKIREAERDALYDEYTELIGHMVSGVIQRYEGGAATVHSRQRRGHPAARRANPRRNAPRQRARADHRFRSPQVGQPRESDP